MKLGSFFENISKRIIKFFLALLLVLIVLAAAFINVARENGYSEEFSFALDNPLINILFFIVVFLFFFLVTKWVSKDILKRRKVLLIAEMIFAIIFGIGFSAVSKCFPTADQASVYYGSKHFMTNYYGDLAETGSYFSVYPHQMALALAQEIILRICHTESYHVLQGVNAVCNAVTIWSLFTVSDALFEDKKISVYTLLLTLFTLPLFWYTPFVYGDLASIGFSLLSLALLLKALLVKYDKKWMKFGLYISSAISVVIATLVRTNTLIFVIGLILCILIYIIKEKKPALLIYVLVVGFLCASINSACVRFYEIRSGQEINDGMPSICHVVMGLQESPMGNGYYNGYNFDTYVNKANYDKELATQIAKEDLNSRLEEFKSDKEQAFLFFKDKFLAQWLSFDFDCYHFTCGAYYERWPIVESLFSGTLYKVTSFFMDKYGFFVYVMALIGVIVLLRKKDESILAYVLPVTIIGGALFYLIWEAAGRYILPYFIYVIPTASLGANMIDAFLIKMMGKSRKNKA